MHKINICKLIQDAKFNYLNEFNISIYRVNIIKDSMKMELFLESNTVLDKKIVTDLYELIKIGFKRIYNR